MASKFRSSQAWDDLRIEPAVRGTGSNNPAFEKWYDDAGLAIVSAGGTSRGVYLYSFSDEAAANEKEIFFTMQLPHDWNQGTIHIHVHWIPSHNDTTATPRWGLEFNWVEPGVAFAAPTIIYATGNEQGAADLVAGTHYKTEFTAQTPSNTQDGLSSIIIGRLFRNSSNAADTYDVAGNKCGLLYIDAHYIRNSTGSISESVK